MTDKIILKEGKKFIISFRDDGYINATELCKAGKKKFNLSYSDKLNYIPVLPYLN